MEIYHVTRHLNKEKRYNGVLSPLLLSSERQERGQNELIAGTYRIPYFYDGEVFKINFNHIVGDKSKINLFVFERDFGSVMDVHPLVEATFDITNAKSGKMLLDVETDKAIHLLELHEEDPTKD